MCTRTWRCLKSAGMTLFRNGPTRGADLFTTCTWRHVWNLTLHPKYVRLKKGTNPHLDAGLRLLASCVPKKRWVLWHYYGSLNFAGLTKKRQKAKMYGVGVIQVTTETFWKCLKKLWGKRIDKNGIRHETWIVPAPLCDMQYMYGEKCLPGDSTA